MKTVYEDLKPFYDWLVESNHVKNRTATTYTSYVRKALRTFGDQPSEHDVTQYFTERDEASSGDAERMAWGKYVLWSEEMYNTRLPRPERTPKVVRRAAGVEPLPDKVLSALHFLVRRCQFDLHQIEKLTWGNVVLLKTGKHTASLAGTRKTYTFPGPCVDVLREYAQPQNHYSPLVPVHSKSIFPYGLKSVRAQLLTFEARLVEKERKGEPLFPEFNPYEECIDSPVEAVRPMPRIVEPEDEEEVEESITPKHTTDDLLRMIDATGPKKPPSLRLLDFESFERRQAEHPGDWRELDDE
jgi:hypothetical protein